MSFSKGPFFAVLLLSVAAVAQTAPPASASLSSSAAPLSVPKFDVISVKPDRMGGNGIRSGFTQDGVSVTNAPLHLLLTQAYGVSDDQLIGEPSWSRTDRFDIQAKVAQADVQRLKALNFDQRRIQAQQILTERFGLRLHHETRNLPEYILVLAKGGPKLAAASQNTGRPMPPGDTGSFRMSTNPAGHTLQAQGAPLEGLLPLLSNETGRTVVDKTGLTGHYDFTLTWVPPSGDSAGVTQPATSSGDAGPTLFTALEEQLGLKLESTKGPVDVLVIDHVQRPAGN